MMTMTNHGSMVPMLDREDDPVVPLRNVCGEVVSAARLSSLPQWSQAIFREKLERGEKL